MKKSSELENKKPQTKNEKFWGLMDEIYEIKNHIKSANAIWDYLGKDTSHGTELMFLISDLSTQLHEKQKLLKNFVQ